MGNQSPELSRIKVNKLINGAGWTLSLSPDYFFKLNSRLCEEEGRSLFALAETDPTTAYDYLRHVIGVSIVSYADEITSDGVRVAAVEPDGPETTRQLAKERILGCLPASYEGPFNVDVFLFNTNEEALSLGKYTKVMQIYVEPPDLAIR
jgi:hypothetical protein